MESSFKDVVDRYGPMLALVMVLVVLVTVLPGNAKGGSGGGDQTLSAGSGEEVGGGGGDGTGGDGSGSGGDAGVAGPAGGDTGGSGPTGVDGPSSSGGPAVKGGTPTGPGSKAAGPSAPSATVAAQLGKLPCRADGRQAGIAVVAPPCRQWEGGDNGGATHKGVTATTIRVASYYPRQSAATQAALSAAGAGDTQEDYERVLEAYRRYWNAHTVTYGREVQLIDVFASGDPGDDVAMKADAQKIANGNYFAVLIFNGTSGSRTFDSAVANSRTQMLCIACTVSAADSFYQNTKGYNFSSLPKLREYYLNIAEYMGKRLVGGNRKAEHAGAPRVGDTDLRTLPRKFGLIWLNAVQGTVDPGAKEERDFFINLLKTKYGITGVEDSSYNYDLTQGPTTAQTVIAKFNTSKVTTIIQIADPLTPVFFTNEAQKQQYFPEWLQTGTLLTDTTFFGRTYQQDQWGRSFGISPLWVFWENLPVSDGFREYHHTCPSAIGKHRRIQSPADCAVKKESVGVNTYRAAFLYLFNGISGAGPNLNPRTFAEGLYKFPPTGGLSHVPLIGFTPDSPVAIKDFTEVYWDRSRRGKDEVQTDGQGVLLKAEQGKRYKLGQWPTTDPKVFGKSGGVAVFTSDKPYLDPSSRKQHEEDGHKHNGDQKCLTC